MGISKRIFGSDIDQHVKDKLESYQAQSAGYTRKEIEQSLNDKTQIPFNTSDSTLKSLGDLSYNFNGSGGLSGRTPWVRMWTGIENKAKIKNPIAQEYTEEEWNAMGILQKTKSQTQHMTLSQLYEDTSADQIRSTLFPTAKDIAWNNSKNIYREGDPESAEAQLDYWIPQTINKQVYQIGTNELQILNEPITDTMGDLVDGKIDGNKHFSIQPGITNLSSNSQGPLGLTRKTTVNFIVQNPHDFDAIYSRYFLRTGALIFVDFGWDTANYVDVGSNRFPLYDPINLLESVNSGVGLEDLVYGDNGVVEKAGGDMETLVGYVTDFNSTLNEVGYYDCSITISSKNSALINSETAGNSEKEQYLERIDAEIINMAARFFGPEHPFLEVNKSYSTNDVEEWNKYARLFAARQFYNYSTKTIQIQKESVAAGVYFYGTRRDARKAGFDDDNSDKIFISFGLMEDVLFNNNLAIGSNEDILSSQPKNFTSRYNSSNTFVRWDTNLSKAIENGVHSSIPVFMYPKEWSRDTYNTIQNKCPLDRLDENNQHVGKYPIVDEDEGENSPAWVTKGDKISWRQLDESKNRIPLREIFVRLDIIKNALLTNDNVEVAMKEILDAINKDSFDIFNLSMHTTNKAESEIAIIDRNLLEITNPSNQQNSSAYFDNMFMFKPASESSIVSNFSLNMNTPKGKMQSMMAIQSSAPEDNLFPYSSDIATQLGLYSLNIDTENTSLGFSYLPETSKDTLDRVEQQNSGMIKMGHLSANASIFNSDDMNIKNKIKAVNFKYNTNVNYREEMELAFAKANGYEGDDDGDLDEKNITTSQDIEYGPDIRVVNSIPELYKLMATNDYFSAGNHSPILQLKLNISIYGINGLQSGDVFRIDYLPKRYRDIAFFQITKVNHKVNTSGWVTELESVMRIRNDVQKVLNSDNDSLSVPMLKSSNVIPQNIVINKSIFNDLGLRIDKYTLKYSSCEPSHFADSISYLRFIRAGCPGKTSSTINYSFKFKANTTNPYLLAKHVNVPTTGKNDWKYVGVYKGLPLARPGELEKNSWYYYRKGENNYDFAINGNPGASKSIMTGIDAGSNLKNMLDLSLDLDATKPQQDKWNEKGKANWQSSSKFKGQKIHFYMFPYYYNSFSWDSGVLEDYFIFNSGVVIYPGREYYLLVKNHNYMVVPVEMPQWMLNRVDEAFAWYQGSGGVEV